MKVCQDDPTRERGELQRTSSASMAALCASAAAASASASLQQQSQQQLGGQLAQQAQGAALPALLSPAELQRWQQQQAAAQRPPSQWQQASPQAHQAQPVQQPALHYPHQSSGHALPGISRSFNVPKPSGFAAAAAAAPLLSHHLSLQEPRPPAAGAGPSDASAIAHADTRTDSWTPFVGANERTTSVALAAPAPTGRAESRAESWTQWTGASGSPSHAFLDPQPQPLQLQQQAPPPQQQYGALPSVEEAVPEQEQTFNGLQGPSVESSSATGAAAGAGAGGASNWWLPEGASDEDEDLGDRGGDRGQPEWLRALQQDGGSHE